MREIKIVLLTKCGLCTCIKPRCHVPAKVTHGQGGVEDVLQVDRKEVEKTLRAGSGDSVAGMVYIRPGVSTLGETTVC